MALVSVADAKAFMNIASSLTGDDALISDFCDAADEIIRRRIGGPPQSTTMLATVWPTAGGRALILTTYPVTSVDSVTDSLGTVATDVVGEYPGRVLRRSGGQQFTGTAPYTVVYTAGLPESAAVTLAAKIIIAHLWATQRGTATGRGASAVNEYGSSALGTLYPGSGYAVPNRALELLDPYAPETGLA